MENKIDDVLIEGLNLNAEMLKNLKTSKLVILGARYENMSDFRDPNKMVRKLILTVEIDKTPLEYYPNRVSVRRLVAKHGLNATKWVGKTAELEVKHLLVGKTERDVLFVKE